MLPPSNFKGFELSTSLTSALSYDEQQNHRCHFQAENAYRRLEIEDGTQK